MTENSPMHTITDDEFDILLQAYWEQIALFAFSHYKEHGRGVVLLTREGSGQSILQDQVDLNFTTYSPGKPTPDAAAMIEAYDPSWEIIFQYQRPDNQLRTTRIRTPPDARHPWRIYLFDQLLQNEEEDLTE